MNEKERHDTLLATGTSTEQLKEMYAKDPEVATTGKRFFDAIEGMKNLFIFRPTDLECVVGERAMAFLNCFSFTPGRVNSTYTLPYDSDAVRSRPFARLDDGVFALCDPAYCYWAPLYRLSECFSDEKARAGFKTCLQGFQAGRRRMVVFYNRLSTMTMQAA
jgi:hypothetical protein